MKRTATAYGGPPDYRRVTETLPLAGATIALPGGGTATTGADGTAAITLTAGGAGGRCARRTRATCARRPSRSA